MLCQRLVGSVVLVLGLISASQAWGKSVPAPLRSLAKLNLPKPKSMRLANGQAAPSCANFTGEWRGTCTYRDGSSEDSSIAIRQDSCLSLEVGGIEANAGGSALHSSAPAPSPDDSFTGFTYIASYQWNDSQTRLHGLLTGSFVGGAYSVILYNSMWLEGERLRMRADGSTPVVSHTGPTGMEMMLDDCTYEKVGNPPEL